MSDARSWPAKLALGDYIDLPFARQRTVADYLELVWEAQFGRPAGLLSADLDALSVYYKPQMTPKSLRKFADELQPVRAPRPAIDNLYLIAVDKHRGLITPEGRAVLELDRKLGVDPTGEDDLVLSLVAALANFYGEPRRDWMRQTLTGGDLRPPTLGYVVFLLLNGSVGRDRALRLPRSPDDERRLADAVVPVANAFAKGIGGGPLTGRELSRLRSNWAVSEAGRQMPGIVRNETLSDSQRLSYVADNKESEAIDRVARSVSERRTFNYGALPEALDATSSAYEDARPLLLTWGMCWSSALHTRAVLEELERRILQHINEGTR